MPFNILRNDITEMQVDAIVNSAHPSPVIGGGVDRAIYLKAGPELLKARHAIGSIETGSAVLTQAYHLQAKYIIHTVGPVWRGGMYGEQKLLSDCYTHALTLAMEHACTSIAFPLISAGAFGFPAELAITTASEAISDFLHDHEMNVYLVVFDRKAFKISDTLFGNVQNYLKKMYRKERSRWDVFNFSRLDSQPLEDASALTANSLCRAPASKAHDIEDLLENIDASFSDTLMHYIQKSNMTGPEVYKRANVDRKHFSKIRNNPSYQPSKTTALAFAVALRLSLDETKDLIARAGFALSHSSKSDIIVEYFIMHREFNIFKINETLFAFGQPLLGF